MTFFIQLSNLFHLTMFARIHLIRPLRRPGGAFTCILHAIFLAESSPLSLREAIQLCLSHMSRPIVALAGPGIRPLSMVSNLQQIDA